MWGSLKSDRIVHSVVVIFKICEAPDVPDCRFLGQVNLREPIRLEDGSGSRQTFKQVFQSRKITSCVASSWPPFCDAGTTRWKREATLGGYGLGKNHCRY